MIVEKIAVKKTLAVTLALALGLSLPGGAWSQVIGPRVAPIPSVGAQSGASFAGAQSITLAMPALTISAVATAPTLALPASAPSAAMSAPTPAAFAAPVAVEAHPVIALINQLQKAGVSLPETLSSRADAEKIAAAAQALPEGSSVRIQLSQLASAIRASHDGSGDEVPDSTGKAFDGSKPSVPSVPEVSGVSATGLGAMLAHVARLLPSSVQNAVGVPPAAPAPQAEDPKKYELGVNQVRYAPVAENLPADTKSIPAAEKKVVGQDDALKAIRFALEMKPDHYNLFVAGAEGSGRAMAIRGILDDVAPKMKTPNDLVAATNFDDKDVPVVLEFAPGQGAAFQDGVEGFVEALKENLPVALNSGEIGQKKQQIMAQVQAAQAKSQAAFDAKIASIKLAGKFGVSFQAQQGEQGMSLKIMPSYEGKSLSQNELDLKVAAGAFTQAEFKQAMAELQEKKGGILEAFKTMMMANMEMMQKVSGTIAKMDRQAVTGLVNEFASELAAIATAGPATPADEAFAKRAEAHDDEINAELQDLAQRKFGKFGVMVQAGVGENGPIVLAMPAIGKLPIDDAVAAQLAAAGKITADEYAQAKAEIETKAAAIQAKAAGYMAAMRKEKEVLMASKPAPTAESQKVLAYVQALADFAASNYKIFMGIKESAEGIKPMPGSRPMDPEDFFRVSLLTDNAAAKGAPVVWENNPTYERLFGEADGNLRNMVIPGVGMVKTDGPGGPTFKTGSYMKANGGFLVLDAMSVLRNPGVWPALMNAVRTGEAEITDGGFMGMASMKGEVYHLPAKVKIVLVGSPMIQMLLEEHDSDFAANFQAIAQFQPTIKITEDALNGFLGFLKHSVAGSAGQIMDLTRDAIERVLEHAARLADSNKYFTAQFGAVHGLLQEASYWAQKAGRSEVRGEDVDAALKAKIDREDVHYKRRAELYQKNIFRIDTAGSVVGQINGLAVSGSRGVQMRITFVAGPGAPGLVSVDHAAGNTGSSFNKALGNEYSFMMHEFGQKKALKAQIRVSYEQNYGGIDGDSSTSTTLYGILSALSGVPISQKFAVTGSADQFGNVQAIGGVNEKIEGFFELCKHRGLTGDQGVIIPRTNVGDLQLSPEVAKAIADGTFHIYAVDHVSQGMEILTGVAYQTIKEKAALRLDAIAKAK
jgi:predicted ATP-dependent protease